MLSLLRFIIITITTLTVVSIQADNHFMRLPNNKINSLCRDTYGFVWMATDRGLCRYDGYNLTEYYHRNADERSLLNNTVNTLMADSQGRLWVGTRWGLQRYNYATNDFESYPDSAGSKPHVSSIIEHDGQILVGTAGRGMFTVQDDKSMKRTRDYGLDVRSFYSRIHIDRDGMFWMAGNDDSVFCMKPHTKQIRKIHSPYGRVRTICDVDGGVLLAARGGLMLWKNETVNLDYFDNSQLRASGASVSGVCVTASGEIIVATDNSGLFCVKKGQRNVETYIFKGSEDVKGTQIGALHIDKNNTLWLGCKDRGVMRISRKVPLFDTWDVSDRGHVTATIKGIMTMGDDTWVATDRGGLYRLNAQGMVTDHASAPEETACLYRDEQGQCWLGASGGLYAFNPSTKVVTKVADHQGDVVNTITGDAHGNIYYSVWGKAGYCLNTLTHTTQPLHLGKPGLDGRESRQWINCMKVVGDKLYVGGSPRFKIYDIGKHTVDLITMDDYSVNTFVKIKQGEVLAGTTAGLVAVDLRTGQCSADGVLQPLADESVNSMAMDGDGNVWVASSAGVWCFNGQTLTNYVSLVSGEGQEFVVNAAEKIDGGRMLMAAASGVLCFNTENLVRVTDTPAMPRLTQIVVNGNRQPTLSNIVDGETILWCAQFCVW